MNYATARQIAGYLGQMAKERSGFSIERMQSDAPLESFHQWANGKPLVSADLVHRDTIDALILLVIDWQQRDEWYLITCDASTRAPLAEIWQEEADASGRHLIWTYRPAKRDGRNDARLAYFRRHVSDVTIRLTVPEAAERSTRFLEDLFDLADNRVRADALDPQEPEPRSSFPEGQEHERRHLARERSAALIRLVKERGLTSGKFTCQVCGFDFEAQYGELGRGFIEAHHTIPVSELDPGSSTRPEDIALVCANCHRMLHRRRPWLRMSQLRDILAP